MNLLTILKFGIGFIVSCLSANTFANVDGISQSTFSMLEFSIVDQQGRSLSTALVNDEIFLRAYIENAKADPQNFTAIVLVKDFTNITEEVMIEERLIAGNTCDTLSLAWIPEKYGVYLVQLFLWDSLGTARPLLSNPASVSINILEHQDLDVPSPSTVDDEHMAGIIVSASVVDGVMSFNVSSSTKSPPIYGLIVSSPDKGLFSRITNTPHGWSSHSIRNEAVGWSTHTDPIKPNSIEHNFSAEVEVVKGTYELRWSVLDDSRLAAAWGTLTINIS